MEIGKFGLPVAKGGEPRPSDKGLVYNRIPMGRGGKAGGNGGGSGAGIGGGTEGGSRSAVSPSLSPSLYGKPAGAHLPSTDLPGLEEAWDLELPALALPEISLKPKQVASVTLTTKWSQDKGFFNDKAVAVVEAVVPEGLQSLTRLVIKLYACPPAGKRELIDSKGAFLSGGRAFCELTLFIPSAREGGEPPKACEYVFTAKHAHSKESESPVLKAEARAMAWLRLKLEQAYQGPLANRKCSLKIAGESYDLATDDKGVLSKFVPADVTEAEILVHEDDAHPKALKLNVAIEKLDPPDRPEGSRDRLDSMGYAPGSEPDHPAFRKAVEEFQCDSGLTSTGVVDAGTQGKLKEAFGC